MVQLMADAIDLTARVFTLAAIHSGAGNPLAGPVHDRYHHLQIAHQGGGLRRRRCRLHLALRFEKQLRLLENAFANHL